ncbi:MAG: hypothetical protein HUK20_05230 [Fibrobacter sp.]|nr:hypothetical protein [Fibrobacter sp.]
MIYLLPISVTVFVDMLDAFEGLFIVRFNLIHRNSLFLKFLDSIAALQG